MGLAELLANLATRGLHGIDVLGLPGASCVRQCLALGVESVLVTEEELKDAFRFLYGRAKLACELAGAATTAALLAGKAGVEPGQKVIAVVSGGNVAAETAVASLAGR